jgi:hypothetical protein
MGYARDVGALLTGFPALDAEVITAAAGNDNQAVAGNILDRLASPAKGFPGLSAQIAVPYKAVLTTAETISYAGSVHDSAASNMASPTITPITRARDIKSDGTVTNLTIASDGTISSTVLATASGATTRRGVLLLDVNLSSAKQYLQYTNTFDLSKSGTDTVAYGGVIIIGGTDEPPNN